MNMELDSGALMYKNEKTNNIEILEFLCIKGFDNG